MKPFQKSGKAQQFPSTSIVYEVDHDNQIFRRGVILTGNQHSESYILLLYPKIGEATWEKSTLARHVFTVRRHFLPPETMCLLDSSSLRPIEIIFLRYQCVMFAMKKSRGLNTTWRLSFPSAVGTMLQKKISRLLYRSGSVRIKGCIRVYPPILEEFGLRKEACTFRPTHFRSITKKCLSS